MQCTMYYKYANFVPNPAHKKQILQYIASIQQNKTLSNFSSAMPSAGMPNALVLDTQAIKNAAYMIWADDNDVTNVTTVC